MTGLGQKLGTLITQAAGGKLILGLLLTHIAALVLGTSLVTSATYVILAVLCVPALVKLGALPIAAHLFVFHFGIIGTLTPPVSLAAYAAAGIADTNPISTGLTTFRMAMPGFIVPYMFVIHPALIGQGTFGQIIIASATAMAGVIGLSSAMEGYFKVLLKIWERIVIGAGGIMLIYPNTIVSLIGIVLILGTFAIMTLGGRFKVQLKQ